MKMMFKVIVGCLIFGSYSHADAATPAPRVHIETDYKNVADHLSMTCKCKSDGMFSAVINDAPKNHDEWVVGSPSFLWSIAPNANLTFATVTEPSVNLSLGEVAFGISYKIKVVVKWIETHSVTKATNTIEAKDEMELDAIRLDGLTVSTHDMIDGMLCDNREGAVEILVTGCSPETQKTLSFALSSKPVETSGIVNKVGCGTGITFYKTVDPLKWTTSKIYWYGTLPGHCCFNNHFEYKFTAALDLKCIVTNTYAMTMPEQDPGYIPQFQTKASIGTPEPVTGEPNLWRCSFTFEDAHKTGFFIGLPTTDQYASEVMKEETYHESQWKATVPTSEGGSGDLYTAKGCRYWLAQAGMNQYYATGSSSAAALQNARTAVSLGIQTENEKAYIIWDTSLGLREVKAKAQAGYNAAWMYHCMYEYTLGPAEKQTRDFHPAYK